MSVHAPARHATCPGNLFRGPGLALIVLLAAWPARAGGALPAPPSQPIPVSRPAPLEAPYEGTRWQYRVETLWAGTVDGLAGAVANMVLSGSDTDRLREWGEAGWELVAIQGNRAYLKRPIPVPPAPAPKAWWWPF
jgi:hypothetical protein